MRPADNTYPGYYGLYIPLVRENNVTDALTANWKELDKFFSSIPRELENYAYQEGKWSIRQVAHHLADTERIMSYRALRFARKDPQQPLPFEENDYVANGNANERSLRDIMDELGTVRESTLSLFKTFSDETLLNKGVTMIGETTVLAIGYLIAGHAVHHAGVVRERYLGRVKK
jgi:hypothetical protein